ncbi:hypothetical protein WJX73_001048 [Symbiochloris irregularis]|uniref:Major facilitator superfamily (MFS) profile domain-containing protein n=1 Tax=Symbiochloris irregularis TaxID=706552 RepID=A0AAW1PPK8_9CHLO
MLGSSNPGPGDTPAPVAHSGAAVEHGSPWWYTPKRLLALFCGVSFLVYLDRGVIACNGVNYGIQRDFNLSLFEDTILPAAFMVGLLIATFIYNELTKRYNAFRLVGWGFLIWALASVGCGLSTGFYTLLCWRIVMGAGEASIINLTGPFIDDVAPPEHKTLWFGMLGLANPLGTAAGYIFGGAIGPEYGWRSPFFVQAVVALPVILFIFLVEPVSLRMTDNEAPLLGDAKGEATDEASERAPASKQGTWGDIRVLCRHPVYLLALLANCPNTGVFGAFAYVGPKAAAELFGTKEESIDMVFGAVTIVTSVIATLVGSLLVDGAGSSIKTSMAFCGWSSVVGFLVIEAAFNLPGHLGIPYSFTAFMALFALGELTIFANTAPTLTVQVWAVPLHLRSLASGLAQVASHVLGDVPYPPLVGFFQDKVLHNWQLTLSLLNLTLFVSQHSRVRIWRG